MKAPCEALACTEALKDSMGILKLPLRVQVPNYHILSKNCNLHNYYPKPEYLIIWTFGPLGKDSMGILKLQTQTNPEPDTADSHPLSLNPINPKP